LGLRREKAKQRFFCPPRVEQGIFQVKGKTHGSAVLYQEKGGEKDRDT